MGKQNYTHINVIFPLVRVRSVPPLKLFVSNKKQFISAVQLKHHNNSACGWVLLSRIH